MFEYKLKFHRTSAHANVDALSRLPLPVEPAIVHELVLLTENMSNSPITAEQIHAGTRRDPVLALLFSLYSRYAGILWRQPTTLYFSLRKMSFPLMKDASCGFLEWLYLPHVELLFLLNFMKDTQGWWGCKRGGLEYQMTLRRKWGSVLNVSLISLPQQLQSVVLAHTTLG